MFSSEGNAELAEELSIYKITNNLQNLKKEIDDHEKILNKGFNEIQSLIDKQHHKFESLSNGFVTKKAILKPEDDEQFDDIKQSDSENDDDVTDLNMKTDLKKITEYLTNLHLNSDAIDHAKLSVRKHYKNLCFIFKRYCIIGGDSDWLMQKGWNALCKDAFIECKDINSIFMQIYDLNDIECDEWSGKWRDNNDEYNIKQLGHNKLVGFINSFDFCDISGSIDASNRNLSRWIIFWHKGARKGKRRKANCYLNHKNEMKIEWESISSNLNTVNVEKGIYTIMKCKQSTSNEMLFKDKMGLARHQYFEAIFELSKMKYPQMNQCLDRLCDDHLIPFICSQCHEPDIMNPLFAKYSTELRKLFIKYNSIDSMASLLGLDEWQVLCLDILSNSGNNAFNNGGKPTNNDIAASFELAKEGYDLQLTHKGFRKALANLAHKLYKKRPNQKYDKNITYEDKLQKLLKWAVKLQKSGYQPTMHCNI